jgi:DNA-3-methyladenine glycosylase
MLRPESKILARDFFNRATLTVARELLGQKLVRMHEGGRLCGVVAETEAYLGPQDSASHAFRGPTARNAPMFGPAGFAYVYFIYGMHHMLNVSTEAENTPGAVLLRAILPVEGAEKMGLPPGRPAKTATDGPAKLCRALFIDRQLNGRDLTRGEILWFEKHRDIPGALVQTGPRIGIAYARAKARQAPWRFRMMPSDVLNPSP